jgi:hypothetical protein
MLIMLRARRKAEVHEMRDGRLALAAIEGAHGELRRGQYGYTHKCAWKTDGLGNGILIGLPKPPRRLVLLLRLLTVARGG